MNYDLQTTEISTKLENVQSGIESSRAVQEVQAMVLVAQKCPRDEIKAIRKILESAKRKSLAENAMYAYPKGGSTVTGASIRTAETIAMNWGNLSYGIKELSQNHSTHASEVMAFCWDLETNVRQEKIFTVPHIRYSRKKGNEKLTDPRDIYEKVANDGARRLRACILGIIPADVVEDFLAECEKTLAGDNKTPLKDRIKAMIEIFESEFGVTKEMIEKRMGTKSDALIEKQLIELRKIYKSIKDNFQPASAFFETGEKNHVEVAQPTSPFLQKEEQTPTENHCANCGCNVTTSRAKTSKEANDGIIYCADCQNIVKGE